MPDVDINDFLFVYIWSISVAENGVTRVGLVISGMNPDEKVLSRYAFVLLCNV